MGDLLIVAISAAFNAIIEFETQIRLGLTERGEPQRKFSR